MTFAGKTMFISGASRGIGLAIAKRVAADGANIALVAKTTEPHPKLPGTIYTAAKEIEEVGGRPCRSSATCATATRWPPRSPRPSSSSAGSTSA